MKVINKINELEIALASIEKNIFSNKKSFIAFMDNDNTLYLKLFAAVNHCKAAIKELKLEVNERKIYNEII